MWHPMGHFSLLKRQLRQLRPLRFSVYFMPVKADPDCDVLSPGCAFARTGHYNGALLRAAARSATKRGGCAIRTASRSPKPLAPSTAPERAGISPSQPGPAGAAPAGPSRDAPAPGGGAAPAHPCGLPALPQPKGSSGHLLSLLFLLNKHPERFLLLPVPFLSQLPDTPAGPPRHPLGSRAPVTAGPARPAAAPRGARGQPGLRPWPRSGHQRRDEAWVGPAELWRQPPGRAAAKGAGPAPPPARPARPSSARPPAGATHRSRGRAAAAPTGRRRRRRGAAWPRRGRWSSPGAVCAVPGEGRAGAGRRGGGRAGHGRGEVGSFLPSPSIFRQAGRRNAAVPVRGG